VGVTAQEQLLERDEELAALVDLLERARDGEGRVVLIEGAAGIGKTRLLQATRGEAKQAGMRVLTARATELERDFPFALVRQLFEPLLHAVEPNERDKLLADAARPAAAVVGFESGDGEASVAGGPADPSFATLNGLYWLTSNVAEAGPLLLVVDDAHWSDKASLRFLRFLLPRLEDLPVLLALAARPAEPGADSGLLDRLVGDPVARVLRPEALSQKAVAELVRSQLSSDAEDEFCVAAHEATAGNPFLLRELLAELTAEGGVGTAGEARHVHALAPATIKRSVLLRLARLSDDAGRLARAVAVLGDDADPRQAGALARLESRTTAVAADALVAAGILESGRPLRFAHPLVRNAVYADLPSSDKGLAHRAAASLLAREGAQPERIAVHLLATDPEADPEVVETLAAAAQRALDRAAPEAAIAYAQRALAEPPHAARRRDLLWQLVRAAVRAGDRAALRDLESEALDELTAEPGLLMESADELAYWLYGQGRFEEGLALLERAKQAALDTEDYDLVMLLESHSTATAPTQKNPGWERHRSRIAPRTQAESLFLALEAWRGFWLGESAPTVSTLAKRALDGGKILEGQPPLNAVGILTYLLIWADELQAAEQALDRFGDVARAIGATPAIAAELAMRGELALARGNVGQAEPDVRAAVEALRQSGLLLAVAADWLGLLVELLIERGELDAAERELVADGMDGAVPDLFYAGRVLHARARLRFAQGRHAEAAADFAELSRRGRRDGIKNLTALHSAAEAAIALVRLGEGRSARGIVELALETARAWGAAMSISLAGLGGGNPARALAYLYRRGARAWGTPRVIGIGLHATGVVRGGEKGIALLREAVATLEDSPARLEHAKALTDLGAALRRANRRAEAREPLRAALEMARRGGALAVAKRAHEELEATGEKLRPLAATGVESLTPSERRIADLAAEGLTNRQIAQTLFLSIKTVESHLRGAYRKLDISSRGELGAALEPAPDSS
jgi:DNA-binding CsgD family transcriptional regulator